MCIINFLLKSGLTVAIFFLEEKKLEKLGLTGEFTSAHAYYMIIPSFQSQFLV